MKKFFYLAVAACAALAACSKNEVVSVTPDQEITYQTISTKAASAMETDKKFVSYAYFLPQGKNWGGNFNDASPYISAATIGYNATANAWKADKTYYWPKQGSLTFFAWSTNNATPSLDPTPTCSAAKGIEVATFDITANKDVDFLVAEIAQDKTANTTTVDGKAWKAGVPTVFKHALSKLDFNVMTVDETGAAKDYSSENITFTVLSVNLKSVKNKMGYRQNWNNASGNSTHDWYDIDATTAHIEVPVFSGPAQEATKTETALAPGEYGYSIVIPQIFDSADNTEDLLEIKYAITTSYAGTPVKETVTQTVKLSTVYPNNWEVNKHYTLTIKLGVKEIFWAPTVEEWEIGTTTAVQF